METKEITGVIYVEAREWFDKSGGNSYFSGRVFIDGDLVAGLPFQYGYGSQFEYSAFNVLKGLNPLLAEMFPYDIPLWRLRELGLVVHTVKYSATKADTIRWGVI